MKIWLAFTFLLLVLMLITRKPNFFLNPFKLMFFFPFFLFSLFSLHSLSSSLSLPSLFPYPFLIFSHLPSPPFSLPRTILILPHCISLYSIPGVHITKSAVVFILLVLRR